MEPRRYIQIFSAAFSLTYAIILIVQARRQRWRSRRVLLAPIICLLVIFVYYIGIFLFSSGGPNLDYVIFGVNVDFNTISAAVTAYVVITLYRMSRNTIQLFQPPRIDDE